MKIIFGEANMCYTKAHGKECCKGCTQIFNSEAFNYKPIAFEGWYYCEDCIKKLKQINEEYKY